MRASKKILLLALIVLLASSLDAGRAGLSVGVYRDKTGASSFTEYLDLLIDLVEGTEISLHGGYDIVQFADVDGISSATSLSRKDKDISTSKRLEGAASLTQKVRHLAFTGSFDFSLEETYESRAFSGAIGWASEDENWTAVFSGRYQYDSFQVAYSFDDFRANLAQGSFSLSRVMSPRWVLSGFARGIYESGDFRDFLLLENGPSPQTERKIGVGGIGVQYAFSMNWTGRLNLSSSIDSWRQSSFAVEPQVFRRLSQHLWLSARYRYFAQSDSAIKPTINEATPGIYLQYASHTAHEVGGAIRFENENLEWWLRWDRRLQSLLSFDVAQMGFSRKF